MGQQTNFSEAERTAWQAMLMAHGRVIGRLDADLISESDMTLAEYEVLDNLAAEDQRLRMNELADKARLSPSGLTRRFDALVRRGWVVRERCDDDRRGVYARITPEGSARLEAARPVHDAGVRAYFFELLEPEDVACMDRVMSSVAEANAPKQYARD
jgi:DNA-binding MarR family transcriptional regulator